MHSLTAVGGSNTYLDILTVIFHERHTNRSPFFPCQLTPLICSQMPSLRISGLDSIGISEVRCTTACVDTLSIRVQNLDTEVGFFISIVSTIIQNHRIFHDQNTLGSGIDGHVVGDRLRLTGCIPVTETYGSHRSGRHRMKHAVGSRIHLRRIDMQGMATVLRVRTVINYTDIVIRCLSGMFLVHTIRTYHIRTIQVNVVDTVVLGAIDENIRLVNKVRP